MSLLQTLLAAAREQSRKNCARLEKRAKKEKSIETDIDGELITTCGGKLSTDHFGFVSLIKESVEILTKCFSRN